MTLRQVLANLRRVAYSYHVPSQAQTELSTWLWTRNNIAPNYPLNFSTVINMDKDTFSICELKHERIPDPNKNHWNDPPMSERLYPLLTTCWFFLSIFQTKKQNHFIETGFRDSTPNLSDMMLKSVGRTTNAGRISGRATWGDQSTCSFPF